VIYKRYHFFCEARACARTSLIVRSGERFSLVHVAALGAILIGAIVAGWVGLFALWWFGFRGRGPDA
jgi:hypothetical protein